MKSMFRKRMISWITGGGLVFLMFLAGGCGKDAGETSDAGNSGFPEEISSNSVQQEDSSDDTGQPGLEDIANADSDSNGDGRNGSMDPSDADSGQEGFENPDSDAGDTVELESFVLYFSGIDVWGWVDTRSRSDVNIIAAVNPGTRHIQLINTPRDYYVEMPVSDGEKDKLTHAGLYGVENSVGTLENLYGIEIDYYVRINFSGFESIIDTMGGVDVYSEYDFTVDPIKHYTEGYNHLTGLEALAFVRERHAFPDGDNQRGRNQMALIQAMVEKVCSPDVLENYSEILDELTDMFRTNIPLELIVDLVGSQLYDDREWTVDTYSVTGTSGSETTYSVPGTNAYVMIPDESDVAEAGELMEMVLNEVPG